MHSYWGIDHGTEISKGQKQWKQGLQNKKRAYHLKKADKWTKRWYDLDEDTSMPYKKFERKQMRAYDKLDSHRNKLHEMGFDEYGRKMTSIEKSDNRDLARGAAAGAVTGAGVATAGTGGLILHTARKLRIGGTSYKDMNWRPSGSQLKYIGTRAVLPVAAVGAAGGLAAAGANNRSRKKVSKAFLKPMAIAKPRAIMKPLAPKVAKPLTPPKPKVAKP